MNLLSYKEAKEISIVDYLTGLGQSPASIRGVDHWYYAPYRDERTPSFKVNAKLNVWYDHGIGQGGSILDLGVKIHECSMPEFVAILSRNDPSAYSMIKRAPLDPPKPKIDIFSISEGFNPNLRYYLAQRGIDESIAQQHCKEIEFVINNRMYSAIGFQNRSGAYELRNNWFKGSSAPKDISFIQNNSERLSVVEGFIDFLSLQQLNRFSEQTEFHQLIKNSNFLILNSIALLNKNLKILTDHKERVLFLDNDQAANNAKVTLREKGIPVQDASHLFTSHKDVNEYLQAIRKLKQGSGQSPKSLKGRRI